MLCHISVAINQTKTILCFFRFARNFTVSDVYEMNLTTNFLMFTATILVKLMERISLLSHCSGFGVLFDANYLLVYGFCY